MPKNNKVVTTCELCAGKCWACQYAPTEEEAMEVLRDFLVENSEGQPRTHREYALIVG